MSYLKINSMATSRNNVFGAIRYYHQWRHKSYLSSSELQMQITAFKGNGCTSTLTFCCYSAVFSPSSSTQRMKQKIKPQKDNTSIAVNILIMQIFHNELNIKTGRNPLRNSRDNWQRRDNTDLQVELAPSGAGETPASKMRVQRLKML